MSASRLEECDVMSASVPTAPAKNRTIKISLANRDSHAIQFLKRTRR